MFYCQETQEKYESDNMQKFIYTERSKTQKKWIFEIIKGARERIQIVFRDPQNRFVIIPSDENRKKKKSYLVIFCDRELKSIRDLRQKHVPLLLEVCKKLQEFLPVGFSHASFHYHPSVYQLHLHVQTEHVEDLENWRIYPLSYVILALSVNTNFFKEATLQTQVYAWSTNLKKLLQE